MDEEYEDPYHQIDISDDDNGDEEYDYPPLETHYSFTNEPPKLAYTYSGISNASSNPDCLLQSRFSQDFGEKVTFLKPIQLYSSINNIVQGLKDLLMLDDDLILYLLYKYKWSSEKLKEKYYDLHYEVFQSKNLTIENKITEEPKQGLCEVCFIEKQLIRNPLCSHYYCKKCWESFIQITLKAGSIFFNCMKNCPECPILTNNFIQAYFPNQIPLYWKTIGINYCQFSKGITYCPSINCGLFCQKDETTLQYTVECLCGEYYCFKCRKEPHSPAMCSDVIRWEQLFKKEQENVNWIKNNTKKCPKCKNAVEKAIGCSYIKCVCGTEFCYKCNEIWDEFHKDSKGECLKIIRKASLKEQSTSELFVFLQQKIEEKNKIQKKYIEIVTSILTSFKQEKQIYEEFVELKKQIKEAFQGWKWGHIVMFLYQKEEVDNFVEEQFINSIKTLMEQIQKISKKQHSIQRQQLITTAGELMMKRQKMTKSQNVWEQACRSC